MEVKPVFMVLEFIRERKRNHYRGFETLAMYL